MNLKLLTLLTLGLSLPDALSAQENGEGKGLEVSRLGVLENTTDLYKRDERVYKTRAGEEFKYNTYSSGNGSLRKFDNKERTFKDWAISLGGGVSFMQRADLTSFYDSQITPGYNAYISLDKQMTHTFGISLQYQMGETTQRGRLLSYDVDYPNNRKMYRVAEAQPDTRGIATATTKYQQVSILGDLNLSNLLRRVDNRSPYRWALHTYLGLGVQGFETQLKDLRSTLELKQDLGISSFFYQTGIGLKYRISKSVDIESRIMYIITGDDEFDGGGDYPNSSPGYNMIKKNDSDNMLTANLGLTFKLGKKGAEHLSWYDPLQEIYYRAESIKTPRTTVCENGDKDDDGVCDDWDRQLNTPAGARVDGAGVALDIDLDGVIDLEDKCVTVPGPAHNHGCPEKKNIDTEENATVDMLNKNFEGVVFDLNKYKINNTAINKLNETIKLIKSLDPMPTFLVIGATDTRGTEVYNQALSQKRANSVVNYLTSKGDIPKSKLIPVGRGEKDLKFPECDPASKCPEWKNEANRRVYFEQKNN
ncbi:MAG: OmpA family protein [Flavobacteriaceae bacterium]|nr:OmpA family protein [Flavobacteriaceae bacterium]